MKIFKITLLIAIVFGIISCGGKDEAIQSLKENSNSPKLEESKSKDAFNRETTISNEFISDSAIVPGYDQKPEPDKKQQHSVPAPATNPDWDKKIIKTASLNLEVKDYNKFYSFIREKVRSVGGYIAQEEQNQSDYKIENNLSIKVPVDQFDNALTQLTTGAEKINEKKITSQDVTSEFIDTKSRMESKKQVRQRYLDLLKQAKNMEEILNVQSEINNIQEGIESAAGRIEYIGHSSAYSTIDLTYFQVLNSSAKDNDKPSFSTKLSNAFRNGWNWVGELFIGLISVWPLLLVGFIAVILFKKARVSKPKQA